MKSLYSLTISDSENLTKVVLLRVSREKADSETEYCESCTDEDLKAIVKSLVRQLEGPLEIAEEIANHSNNNKKVFDLSASKPGFVNFHITNKYYIKVLGQILTEKKLFGKHKKLNQKANVEFVSCNPTGPLTVGHGRQAILGDMISNILTWKGYDVTREYYYNNAGK